MSFPTLPEYFLEVPLYRELSLETQEIRDAAVRIHFFNVALDAHCVGCNSISVFRSQVVLPKLRPDPNSMSQAQSIDELLDVAAAFLPRGDDRAYGSHEDVRDYIKEDRHFETVVLCSRDRAHDLRVLSRVSTGHLQKVGQFPSLADLHSAGLGRYRKLLGDHYPQLTRGVGLVSHWRPEEVYA